MIIPASIFEIVERFVSDVSLFALPLQLSSGKLESRPAIPFSKDSDSNYQIALSQLDSIINTKDALYVILRRNNSLIVVTYIPYRADANLKQLYLDSRHELVQKLGESHFDSSVICKEPGEVTDARSWEERDEHGESQGQNHEHDSECEDCVKEENQEKETIKDLGYKRNKCRLCDRRMKNKIAPDALEALKSLGNGGDCVQISVDIPSLVLTLNFHERNISPSDLLSKLPRTTPSYTFYRHPTTSLLYFIWCSPDEAPVKVRMSHTMAIPGLVNVIAKEQGAEVDQKIEIHDPEDLEFAEDDERIGKFRSVYLLNETKGTESRWEGMPVS